MKALALFLLTVCVAFSEIRVVTTYRWIGDLVRNVGGDKVDVFSIGDPKIDPHFVPPKPSFIAKLRKANLLVVNGAGLEDGFLPPLLSRAGNPKIMPGSSGYLDLSDEVQLIEVPRNPSRAFGDVHPYGNPHYHLDPYNIPILAKAIKKRLCYIREDLCPIFERNLNNFLTRWDERLKVWDERMKPLRGTKVIAYHSLFNYFIRRYGLVLAGTVEPKPGIPPSPRHLGTLVEKAEGVRFILQDVYHERKSARYLSEKTGAEVLLLPHDVGSLEGVDSIFSLFEEIVGRFTR
ncbi:MAG: zinc ABC transporter substrate-binding protein [Aquificota bacterium]|nr:zinc ABC transporter substrate-binding protein [Aquificota bacterium]